ncbi:2-hydroxyglutaryl-CoA dehydratase [Candidatus Bathyarchaeota archaeon]|nr:MAG: 2-hydroxyglutaryl-CoA dehydratase [Candidatus Bathyarchaeota archaeon]
MKSSFFMGIDIGVGTSKGVIINEEEKIVAYHILPSGFNYKLAAQKLLGELLGKAGLTMENLSYTVATGQGSPSVNFANEEVTDIVCCARGINKVFPSVRTVIDLGEQTSRVIHVDESGRVANFMISEKCAGGSGYILRVVANVLRVKLEDLGPLSLKSEKPVSFTTRCAVFAETEIVSMVAEGFQKEDIVAGVHKALADKIFDLINRIGLKEPCAIAGGGGCDIGFVKRLKEKLRKEILIPPQPQIIMALGAAIIGKKKFLSE